VALAEKKTKGRSGYLSKSGTEGRVVTPQRTKWLSGKGRQLQSVIRQKSNQVALFQLPCTEKGKADRAQGEQREVQDERKKGTQKTGACAEEDSLTQLPKSKGEYRNTGLGERRRCGKSIDNNKKEGTSAC